MINIDIKLVQVIWLVIMLRDFIIPCIWKLGVFRGYRDISNYLLIYCLKLGHVVFRN